MKWLDNLRAAAAVKRRNAGYSYAAALLLNSKNRRPIVVASLECQADNQFNADEFEDGIRLALNDFARITNQITPVTAEMVRAGRDVWDGDEPFMMNLKHAYQAMRAVELQRQGESK